MPTTTLTDPIYPLLEDIAGLLEDRINYGVAEAANQAAVLISPGAEMVLDKCCPGVGWVRMVSAYPTQVFPNVYAPSDSCSIKTWAAEVELGSARCAKTKPSRRGAIDDADVVQDGVNMMQDAVVLLQLINYDLPIAFPDELSIGVVRPLDIEGGCMGATVNVTIPFNMVCDPLPAP